MHIDVSANLFRIKFLIYFCFRIIKHAYRFPSTVASVTSLDVYIGIHATLTYTICTHNDFDSYTTLPDDEE